MVVSPSDTVNPVSTGVEMLADKSTWTSAGILKEVSAMMNRDKSTLPTVGNALVRTEEESTLKERITCGL